MSRVRLNQKYMNVSKYDATITNTSKMKRIHFDGEDYHKASSLSSWLFMKYDISYKQFRNKSKSRRDSLQNEYIQDTGNKIKSSHNDD